MSKGNLKKADLILTAFLILNAAFFIFSNTRPVTWLQDEIPEYRFFWSMDGIEKFTLHSGFTLEDFKKPFVCRYTVGAFRPRQMSNFVEMVLFKIGQLWDGEYFRDNGQIILHVLNVVLLGIFIKRITGSLYLACLSGVLALNAGVSLATLLFPFRVAKILVITFFFGALIIIDGMGNSRKTGILKTVFLFMIMLAGFFTDETWVFLVPLLWVYWRHKAGHRPATGPQTRIFALILFGTVLTLGTLFYFYSRPYDKPNDWHQSYLHHLGFYGTQIGTVKDIFRSAWLFVSRNFGYWEITPTGIPAACSFATMIVLAARKKPPLPIAVLSAAFVSAIIVKTVIMPHMKVFPFFMPEGTVFPSLLYFTYYYPYPDLFLIVTGLTFLLSTYKENPKILLVFFVCATIIAAGNLSNISRGIYAPLKFHGLDIPERKILYKAMIKTKQIMDGPVLRPVYLSFPAGDNAMIDGRFGFDDTWPLYPAYILTMFLPPLEKKEAIISLENISGQKVKGLGPAKTFYDVPTSITVNLEILRQRYGLKTGDPVYVSKSDIHGYSFEIQGKSSDQVMAFIKGAAVITCEVKGRVFEFKQFYGESYQLFLGAFPADTSNGSVTMSFRVHPANKNRDIEILGPVVINR